MKFSSLVERSRDLLSLTTFSLNKSALSVFSIKYNPTPAHSEYVDYLFGDKAIHIDIPFNYYQPAGKRADVFEEKYEHFEEQIRSRVKESQFLHRPKCSLEIFGYSFLEVHEPFLSRRKVEWPALGYGEVVFMGLEGLGDLHVDCIYRGLHEQWLQENADHGPNYWSTIFYCPIKRQTYCDAIKTNGIQGNPIIKFRLDMHVNPKITWTSYFEARLRPTYLNPLKKTPTVAVCTVMPYASIDEDKIVANVAIFNTWIEYYLHLGFAVIVYDREGETYRQSVNHSYDFLRDHANSSYLKNLIYHDFTVLTKIHPVNASDLSYDNIAQNSAFWSSHPVDVVNRLNIKRWRSGLYNVDHDKQLSFTHCRFEANAVLGIQRVVIADFDEFLFCPSVNSTYNAQRMFLDKIFHSYETYGAHQLTFQQRILNNKTESVRDCLIEKAKAHASVFDCYSSTKFVAGMHSEKSVHLKHVCPMTGFHTACPNDRSLPYIQDCQCNSELVSGEVCAFIHVVTNQERLQRKNFAEEIPIIRADESDIKKVLESSKIGITGNILVDEDL